MSTFKLNSFPGLNDFSKTASGINFLNIKPEKSQQTEQQTTGLLSKVWSKVWSKGREIVLDKLLKLILYGLSLYVSILRRFIPSSIWNFLMFIIPALLAFYEIPLRGYFPRLPSLFAITIKLYQRGVLTVDIIIWLASSLPGNFLGGLGALGGVAMQTTAAMAGGAASVGNAVVGTATGIAGNASKTVAQGFNQAASITTAGVHGAAVLAGGTTQAVAGGLSAVKNGQTAVKDLTGNAVGATKTAVTENATKLANVLDSVNPLNIMSKGSQDSQASSESASKPLVPNIANPSALAGAAKAAATENVTKVANALDSVNPLRLNVLSKGSESSHANSIGGLLRPNFGS